MITRLFIFEYFPQQRHMIAFQDDVMITFFSRQPYRYDHTALTHIYIHTIHVSEHAIYTPELVISCLQVEFK